MPAGPSFALTEGKPPVIWLLLAAVAAVAGGVVAGLLGETAMWAIIAWVAAGPVAFSLIAAFSSSDTRQRAQQVYSRPEWVTPAYVGCLVLAGLAVCLSAVRIALWFGQR